MSGRSSCTRVDPCGVPTYCPLLQISMVDRSDVSQRRKRVVGVAAVDERPLVGRVGSVPC
jgi:hypothetical protein